MIATRLTWFRHTLRMDDNVPCRKINFSQPEGRRKKERLGLRWLDCIKRS
jgi:hypothetical protein